MTDGGHAVCNPAERSELDPVWLQDRIELTQREARRRRVLYGGGLPRRPATGRCAILVDDGIASGLPLEAAIQDVAGDQPSHIVVAVAVASAGMRERFRMLCDDFVAVEVPQFLQDTVGAHYADFAPLTDDDVLDELNRLNAVPQVLLGARRGASAAASARS